VSNLRLRGVHETLVIGDDFWEEILDWAEDNGWRPEQPACLYRGDTGLQVTAFDANNLGDTLEYIAGDIALFKMDAIGVPERFASDLLNGLMTLTTFFQSGSFRIC